MLSQKRAIRSLILRIGFSALFLLPLWLASQDQDTNSAEQLLPGRGLQDLYEIFRDEIRPNPAGNVYASLGNKFQLEASAYSKLSLALTAYEALRSQAAALAPERLSQKQVDATRIFLAAVSAAGWPTYQIVVSEAGLRFSGPASLRVHQAVEKPLVFVVQNTLPRSKTVELASQGVRFSKSALSLGPNSTRYVHGTFELERDGTSNLKVRVAAGTESQEKVLSVTAEPTAILEGILVDPASDDAPTVRLRVTDTSGNYFPPEDAAYGLVVDLRGTPRRWTYAQGRFRVRVPRGPVRISIRKGLEYQAIDQEITFDPTTRLTKRFVLKRWINMKKRGFYSGDVHVHMLDPSSALFEMRAEDLHVVNVLVFKHLSKTYSREHFTGSVDSVSTQQRVISYDEEYRNDVLGHVGLLKLKDLVEPISTGTLAVSRPNVLRHDFSPNVLRPDFSEFGAGIRSRTGEAGAPDYPLLLESMKRTHQQGGLVNWAHLRASGLEFPVDAALGGLDSVDILTHTNLTEALRFWYDLLNCGFRLAATAGTDRVLPREPVGHQRVCVRLKAPFTYDNWIEGLRRGASFVTNGPFVILKVDGVEPGGDLKISSEKTVHIQAHAVSGLPFERLEVIVNGEVAGSAKTGRDGLEADLDMSLPIGESAWIAARCMGARNPELYYSHPVFAHTNPVYAVWEGRPLEKTDSACRLLEITERLSDWVEAEAYFESNQQRQEAIQTIRRGQGYYRRICQNGKRSETTQ